MYDDQTKRLWGFHPLFESYYLSELEEQGNLVPARIVFTGQDHFEVLFLGNEKSYLAKARGHLQEMPAVGDWVLIENIPGDHAFYPIYKVLPRRSCLQRADGKSAQILLANTDIIGLVTSFNQDLNVRRLERGLLMVQESGAQPLILVNKSDLISTEKKEEIISDLENRFSSVPIIACSAVTGEGIKNLQTAFGVGETVTFLGMSGVGKSSLSNAILGEQKLETSSIREDDSRGRHTTTARHLIKTPQGFWIADTPGIREFSLRIDQDTLDEGFDDILAFAENCRFKDCQHHSEPGCGILAALERGDFSEERWKSYNKLQRELAFQSGKGNKERQSQLRKTYAKFSRDLRVRLQMKGKK